MEVLGVQTLQLSLAGLKVTLRLLGALSHLIGHVGQLTVAKETTDVLQLEGENMEDNIYDS